MHRFVLIRLGTLAALALALAVTGCFDAAQQPKVDTYARPAFVDMAGDSSAVEDSTDIDGVAGGAYQVDHVTLVVPPGAFDGKAKITVLATDRSKMVYDLSIVPAPVGGFKVPVTITVDCHGVDPTVLTQLGILWYDPSANVWRGVKSTSVDLAGESVTATLDHFSTYAVAKVGSRAGW